MVKKLYRLYLDARFEQGTLLTPSPPQVHYLMTVMRMKSGDYLEVFNETSGNWLAELILDKKNMTLKLIDSKTPPKSLAAFHLYYTALKKHRLTGLIEKATELGVTHFHAIKTQRTTQPLPSLLKLQAIAIEASEQSERLDIPKFYEECALKEMLNNFPSNETLYVARETRDSPSLLEERLLPNQPLHLLIGPEGGFAPAEFDLMDRYPCIRYVTVSHQILRSETAALAAIATLQMMRRTHE